MAVRLAEGRFGFQPFGIHPTFDDDLGIRRHHQRHRLGFDNADGRFDQPAGDGELVDIVIQFLRGDIGDRRHAADAERRRHFLSAGAIFFPVHVDALAQFQ